MATWKYSAKQLNQEEVENAIKAARGACFRCGKSLHSNECPISKLSREIAALKEAKP